jgi:hypothetical protein
MTDWRAFCFWHNPAPQSVKAAVLCTLAYADLFDYPLTSAEVHRYLVGVEADLPAVDGWLNNGRTPGCLVRSGAYFALSGREEIVDIRRARAGAAAELWPVAVRYAEAIARLPFVRMTAVTGALAVDNAEPGDDVDYLIVTAPDRLWLCRAMIIHFVVKPAERQGITLCPNYLLSERALAGFDHNLFTAHEIVQMVPVTGHGTYRRICQLNGWAARFLPNAYGHPRSIAASGQPARGPLRRAEPLLQSPAGGWLEHWEMKRKIHRFHGQCRADTEASFSADWCKGHFESHGRSVREALFRRLETLNWDSP